MTSEQAEKRVTWAELFFDLVFAFALTEVSALLLHDHSPAGIGRALVVFVPIYWAWVGTSVHANTHDVDNLAGRLGIFAVGLCSMFMALAVPGAYGERGAYFGAAYFALRIILAGLVFWGDRTVITPYSVALYVTGPLMLVGGLLDGPARLAVWSVAAAVDLATPLLTRRRLTGVRFHAEHLPERFGLFLIIALGESIVAVGVPAAAQPDLSPVSMVAVAVAFVLACSLWWVYFVFAADTMRHRLATTTVQTDVIRQMLSYGHLALIASILAVAVGLEEVVSHPGHELSTGAAALLFGGCALYLATFGLIQFHMSPGRSMTRSAAAVVVLALLPVAWSAPAVLAPCLLVVVLVPLNAVEHLVDRRARAARSEQPAAGQ
ncbi:low temperature requirement protein A [Kutzneria chonburiensis]|uniref:Low temperature requirement protein A n=1 Tax=Kutzneria chonburiensis TaxID=1483604 RepID=A0ABV6MYF3_9PSEU|nr:low temperature requirement protein A [Kutzneria chonburiensis]